MNAPAVSAPSFETSISNLASAPPSERDIERVALDFNIPVRKVASALNAEIERREQTADYYKREALQGGQGEVEPQSQTPEQGKKWAAVEPLNLHYESLPYPLAALPELIRKAVIEVEDYVQAPTAMVAACALTNVSIACQAHIDVARDGNLRGPVSLYFQTLADSGERKTTCENSYGGGIEKFQIHAAEDMADDVKRYISDSKTHEAKCVGLLSEIRKLAAAGKPTESKEEDHRELVKAEPVKPKVPNILLTDVTPEALAFSLKHNWPAAAIVSDEGGAVFGGHGMGKDSVMRYLSTLNTLWGGGTLRIGRRSSESYSVVNGRLSLHIQIQPAALNEFLDRSGTLARGSGFFARCLISVPQSTQGTRAYRPPPAESPALDNFNAQIYKILKTPVSLNERGELQPSLMQLSPEAMARWVGFFDVVERELRQGGDFEDLKDTASKVAENAARLAALFAYFEMMTPAMPISDSHMESGVAVATWHLYESQRFFAGLAATEEQRITSRLNDWLVQYCIDNDKTEITRRDIQQLGPSPTRDKVKRDRVLEELERLNRVALVKQGRTDMVIVNPALISGDES